MESRIICFDCGASLRHRKAISEATVEKVEGNVYRIFCRKCAQKRNLLEQKKSKSEAVIKIFVGVGIVTISILFWNWYKDDTGRWGATILAAGTIIIVFLFKLYDDLKY